jgi:hypothetical protein
MKPVTIWYFIKGDGCGSATIEWYLSEAGARTGQQEAGEDAMADCTVGHVETFEGSDIHNSATMNYYQLIG